MRPKQSEIGGKNISGKHIRELRIKAGMQQKELLVKLWQNGVDLDASSLSKIEGQTRRVLDYELLAFAEILQVDIRELLTGIKSPARKK